MCKQLLSVGVDVGTTTTQLIVSRLTVENKASAFAVPELDIAQREILYRSPIHFTPLIGKELVDGEGVRDILEREYRAAGIRKQEVDTGAIIITGETSRKENAAAVLSALSDYAGEFVVATAGPDMESVLAAKGSGAVDYSEKSGKTVLHMDIGGGTSNLALVRAGEIVATTCLNVGGRLVKLDANGEITYVSPALAGIWSVDQPLQALAEVLVSALEMASGLREATPLLQRLTSYGASSWTVPGEPLVLSFSGGVADCIEKSHPTLAFGDLGPDLGQAIRQSRLCQGEYRLGSETIRATVIGAGCHSAQLSGSTVYSRGVPFPLKNLPVAHISEEKPTRTQLQTALARQEGEAVLSFPGMNAPDHATVCRLAEELAQAFGDKPVRIALEADMALALGQRLALLLPQREILCLDRVRLTEGSYLDVGAPVGAALPVVVKTLILEK